MLSATIREPAVHCIFYIDNDKALFARLHGRRDEIEELIGASLAWHLDDDQKSSTITMSKAGDWREKSEAPALAAWLVNMADTFAEVFAARM